MNGVNYRKPIGLTPEMKNLLIQDDNYIILTGLGGTAGTGLISSVLAFLNDHRKKFLAICSLPFYNEGRTRNLYALLKQSELKDMVNVHCFDANYLLERMGQLTVREAFARVEDQYYQLFMKYSDHFLESDVN
jgi:cell division GTPase FtsZ